MVLKETQKQTILFTAVLICIFILSLIYGAVFDLNTEEIKEFAFEVIILTFLVIIPLVLLMEWVFEKQSKRAIDKFDKRLKKVENRVKTKKITKKKTSKKKTKKR